MKKGTFSKLGVAMAAALSFGATVPATHQTHAQQQNAPQTKKDAVESKQINKTPDQVRQQIRDFVKASKKGPAHHFLNQRQYRKRCRQNPSMYKSKKHRSRN